MSCRYYHRAVESCIMINLLIALRIEKVNILRQHKMETSLRRRKWSYNKYCGTVYNCRVSERLFSESFYEVCQSPSLIY